MTTATMTRPTKPAAIGGPLEGPAVYVACLAAYNSGTLHGYWVNLEEASTAEAIRECIAYVLATSPALGAEEYAIHDSQGLPACLKGEWPDWQQVESFLDVFLSLDEEEGAAYVTACDLDYRVLTEDEFSASFCGFYDSPGDFAAEHAEESTGVDLDVWPFTCIDWEDAWRSQFECDSYHAEFIKSRGAYAIFAP